MVGVTNQRATTVIFDPGDGRTPSDPRADWQDLRTVIDCLIFQGQVFDSRPTNRAPKSSGSSNIRDDRSKTKFSTIESWITWHLSDGSVHVTDQSNAAVTGLVSLDATSWDANALGLLSAWILR